MLNNSLLRQIPKVDEILAHPLLASHTPGDLLTNATRQALTDLRSKIQEGSIASLPCRDSIAREISRLMTQSKKPNLQRVINGTGIILHTNLGRAPLAKEALEAISEAARDYSNLEYCIDKGKRDSRHTHIEGLLTQLTGAEAAMVVNNNAAAVLLALSAVAQQRDVIVSRGELVEIGGSFRIPDVMLQSGCRLVEVGTTNKTHPADYEKAVAESTGALLRVHTSNFVISGFVAKPTLAELSHIAQKHAIPLIEDLGSGCMVPLQKYDIHGQPVVADSIKAGVDIVTFSGDKLLGGPQAGIIVGKSEFIAKMKAHPLARALRIDKLSLAALEATLRLYLNPDTVAEKIPTLRMLCAKPEALFEKAELLAAALTANQSQLHSHQISIVTETSQAGGGAMPEEDFATAAVSIVSIASSESSTSSATNSSNASYVTAQAIEQHFRSGDVPIVGRISRGRFLLDVRTLCASDFPIIAARLGIL